MSKEAWMETFSGKKIYLSNPKVEDICLSDIAIALSHICRFGGHVSQPYSVASHSLAVMHLVREMRPDSDPKTLRTALFHDATEAYLGDIIRPFKRMDIMSPYRDLEDVWWKVIAEKFDLHDTLPDVVKRADEIALAVERDRLRPISLRDWNGLCDADEAVKVIGNMVSTLSEPRGVAKKFYRKAEALGVVELAMADHIRPSYYVHESGIHCHEITDVLSFNAGNVVKYLWRFREKNGREDLIKADFYLNQWVNSPHFERDFEDAKRVGHKLVRILVFEARKLSHDGNHLLQGICSILSWVYDENTKIYLDKLLSEIRTEIESTEAP